MRASSKLEVCFVARPSQEELYNKKEWKFQGAWGPTVCSIHSGSGHGKGSVTHMCWLTPEGPCNLDWPSAPQTDYNSHLTCGNTGLRLWEYPAHTEETQGVFRFSQAKEKIEFKHKFKLMYQKASHSRALKCWRKKDRPRNMRKQNWNFTPCLVSQSQEQKLKPTDISVEVHLLEPDSPSTISD